MSSDWEEQRQQLNELHKKLLTKPETEKKGYVVHPGGILNAYREADIDFGTALMRLKAYYETEEIRVSPEVFLHLRALCNAFEIADETEAKNANIYVGGLGSIHWAEGEEVIIHLERPIDKT